MIIVKLRGGLGNQIFQYAIGRRSALKHRTELKLDIVSGLNVKGIYASRQYELHNFAIDEKFATWWERKSAAGNLIKLFSRQKIAYVREKHFHFDEEMLNLPDNSYLEGSWQTEKYFLDVSDVLRKELVPREELSKQTLDFIKDVEGHNSVAIHVRRTDYVANPYSNKKHGVCGMNYYRRAMSIIRRKIKGPKFYVFSDEFDWVKSNFPETSGFSIVGRAKNDFEDLWLMSRCRHFIIANSTFSWWGAWLGNRRQKIVVAPKQWMIAETYNTKDVIPDRWIKI